LFRVVTIYEIYRQKLSIEIIQSYLNYNYGKFAIIIIFGVKKKALCNAGGLGV
jgi:hypothetical protein